MKKINPTNLLLILLVACSFISCRKDIQSLKPEAINPGFKEYVSAFTSGKVSVTDGVVIQFAQAVDSAILSKDPDPSWFKFKPSIKGSAAWINAYTLQFTPTENLSAGTTYQGDFALDKLFPKSSDLGKFPLFFVTSQQDVRISGTQLSPTNGSNNASFSLDGNLLTQDDMVDAMVEKLLSVKLKDENLTIAWQHDDANKTHRFHVENIQRINTDQTLVVLLDGSPAKLDKKQKVEFVVSGINNISFLHADIADLGKTVNLTFSNEIDNNQDLKQFIDLKGGFDYAINKNIVKLTPKDKLVGENDLTINKGIKDIDGNVTTQKVVENLLFSREKPQVLFISKGNILPSSKDGLIVPFKAISLNAVDVRVLKIFGNNVGQFLQVNEIDGAEELARVARTVLYKRIPLDLKPGESATWKNFSLDLTKLINVDPGAIYRIEISFRKGYYDFDCSNIEDKGHEHVNTIAEYNKETSAQSSSWDDAEEYYSSEDEDGDNSYWEDRDNPCKYAYYNSEHWATKNIVASNLGIIAKQGADNDYNVFVTDLRTTEPQENVLVQAFNYQMQMIAQAKTNGKGFALLPSNEGKAYLIIASKDKERNYVKVGQENALSLSMFDVSGASVQNGLKGFIYGERGVWRPGDTLHVSFMLEDKNNTLPMGHPISLNFLDAQHRLVKHLVTRTNATGIYSFDLPTDLDAATGNWQVIVGVGGTNFYQTFKVESIKPNRLKIKLTFPEKNLSISSGSMDGNLEVKWLAGSVAKNLKAKIGVNLVAVPTHFDKYANYIFDDPSKHYTASDEISLFDDNIDNEGKGTVPFNIDLDGASPPGMLRAVITTRVFEEGGDFSINQMSMPYAPYKKFVGLLAPKGDDRGMVLTDQEHKADIVVVDADGNPLANQAVTATLYKLDWRWWWDASSKTDGLYSSSASSTGVVQRELTTDAQGKAQFSFEVKYPSWGRYYIQVRCGNAGHSTGKVIYIDWPGWAKRVAQEGGAGASMLMFTSDKTKYNVGEQAVITIPSSKGGRALISVENGSRILQYYWVDTEKDQTVFKLNITPDMSPNVYLDVTLIQPHAQTQNDVPIRTYGIIPLLVQNVETQLKPVINTANEYRSAKEISIDVKEQNGKPMYYTLAVVDEGLLDLTNFPTPDPWNFFYKKEALGVNTWDIYDRVIGSFGGRIESLFAVGGGAEGIAGKQKEVNRFKPVVKFLGPFELKAGKTNTHKLTLPVYVGSVRVMVVASNNKGAYGNVEKAVPVKEPLMILATMPRVLGPQEHVKLPVTVFCMSDKIKTATVKVEYLSLLTAVGTTTQTVSFTEQGDKTIAFDAQTLAKLGVAKVKITASSGNEKAEQTIELNVRASNPIVNTSQTWVVNAGESISEALHPLGIEGTNGFKLEFSSLPPLNAGRRLYELIAYPHGCIEQTTSSVFPQLYLPEVMELTPEIKTQMTQNIKAGIERIAKFQTSDGGFSYWIGQTVDNAWGTSYAGNFLLEAEKAGYQIPSYLKKNWISYQRSSALSYTPKYETLLDQAFRLYTLALAGKPELGAMNRLREYLKAEGANVEKVASWQLASAYILAGQKEVATDLVDMTNLSLDPDMRRELAGTYGSYWRNKSKLLEMLVRLGNKDEAFKVAKSISDQLNSSSWMSTQETAYSLMSLCMFMSNTKNDGVDVSVKVTNTKGEATLDQRYVSKLSSKTQIINPEEGNFTLKNNTSGSLYVVLSSSGSPLKGKDVTDSKNIKMIVKYVDADGKPIDIHHLSQGTDFVARVIVSNVSYDEAIKNLALTEIFPAGWEITNTRLYEGAQKTNESAYDYRDIRDDRVMTYFDLPVSHTSKVYEVYLTAAYVGTYYMPAIHCEAMYDNTIYATEHGLDVQVTK